MLITVTHDREEAIGIYVMTFPWNLCETPIRTPDAPLDVAWCCSEEVQNLESLSTVTTEPWSGVSRDRGCEHAGVVEGIAE
jgi:hypothetical protein